MARDTVHIVVDGVPVEAKQGQTIMQACDAAGIYIPRLCYHPDLPFGGHCRVCTCKVNGQFAGTCYNPALEGMVVENDTVELNEKRKRIIEMLFVTANHFCPFCEKSGDCELQALGYRFGLEGPRMPYLWPKLEIDASHPDIYLDCNRCVICGRCVRASRFVDRKYVFGMEYKSIKTRIAVDAKEGLGKTNLKLSDKAAHICPVGSLMVKRNAFKVPYGKRTYDKLPIGSDIEQKKEVSK
jgi:[NiFe] hydrogenase diaphorase moiety small subunit